jgi:hypothetical protein
MLLMLHISVTDIVNDSVHNFITVLCVNPRAWQMLQFINWLNVYCWGYSKPHRASSTWKVKDLTDGIEKHMFEKM